MCIEGSCLGYSCGRSHKLTKLCCSSHCSQHAALIMLSGTWQIIHALQLEPFLDVHGNKFVTRGRQNQPSNIREPAQRSTQHKTAARSSADLTKPYQTPSRETHAKDTIILHTAEPKPHQVCQRTHDSCTQGCACTRSSGGRLHSTCTVRCHTVSVGPIGLIVGVSCLLCSSAMPGVWSFLRVTQYLHSQAVTPRRRV